MVRARLKTAAGNAALYESEPGTPHERISSDYLRARRAILDIAAQDALLDNNPVIQKSILLRNPYTDVLNMLQIELLKRRRQGSEDDQGKEDVVRALLLSVYGIAAAMQSTG